MSKKKATRRICRVAFFAVSKSERDGVPMRSGVR